MSVGIRAIAYALPDGSRSVRELAAAGWLESEPAVLEAFGFDRVRVAGCETPYELALAAARALLDREAIDPASIGLVVYGGASGPLAFARAGDAPDAAREACTLRRFAAPALRLQYELGLVHAAALGVEQLACTSLLGAVRVARALCASEGAERALCVSAELFPALAGRESLYNCTSDAACAVLVERGAARNRIVGTASVSKGWHWDPTVRQEEMVASYFPTARTVMARAVADAGWTPAQVDWVIPHNVSRRSWDVLLGLAGLSGARLWDRNIARLGHTLSGDNFINLHDALAAGDVRAGERLLLFSYGFGAHWTALAVEA